MLEFDWFNAFWGCICFCLGYCVHKYLMIEKWKRYLEEKE